MEKRQKDILIEKRVELVETLDMTGGLYTQLMARKVLNQRKVNEIKLHRSPEAQAEELLSHLPKKDCFDALCDALIADEQDHIVEKILKPSVPKNVTPSTVPDSNPGIATTAAPTSIPQNRNSSSSSVPSEPAAIEDTDSAVSLKRPLCPSPPQAVVCIKEADEKYLYIQYSASPEKRQRSAMKSSENRMADYEKDDTRYAMKHFVADNDTTNNLANLALVHPSKISDHSDQLVVFQNTQSLLNPNISDQARYGAAFLRQQAEKPFEHFPPSVPNPSLNAYNSTSCSSLSNNGPSIRNENICNGRQQMYLADRQSQSSNQNGRFISIGNGLGSLSASNSPQKLFGSNFDSKDNEISYMEDPVKLLQHTGVLKCTKGPPAMQATPPQFSLDGNASRTASFMADSVDCAAVSVSASPVKSFILPSAIPPVTYSPSKMMLKVPDTDPDLEIDLPDGCVNVQVEHSTKQFFLNNFKKSYPMRQIPRGLALVMNVDEVKGKPPRKGTNFDRDNLCNLLSQLHFNCVVYNDNDGLSAQEMVNKLKNFAKLKEHYNYDACFICLLSHGEEGYIFGTDGKRIPLEEIFMLFGNTSCKGLIGKPKVFIIQACRGGTLDKGVRMDEPDGGTVLSPPASVVQQLPSLSDMLICYPTQMGYYAWRNRARGSWYIEAIVQVFMRYAKCEDICAMLNRVNQVVSRKVSECNLKEMNQMSQMSEYKSTLRQPHLFLFPGIGCSNQ